jgi:hypothetical protein
MKYSPTVGIFVICAALAGCSTPVSVPVQRHFPEAPAELLQPAPALKPLPANTTELSVLIDNANDNYSSFRVLREHYEAWQQWYQEQRANFDTVK